MKLKRKKKLGAKKRHKDSCISRAKKKKKKTDFVVLSIAERFGHGQFREQVPGTNKRFDIFTSCVPTVAKAENETLRTA